MTLRFGFAGTGYWAEQVHLPVLSTLKDVTLAGIWGRSSEKTHTLADKFGTSAFERFEDLLNEVDAVAFAIAPAAQAALATKAAQAGKHLFLEKPVATTSDEAQRLAKTVKESGVASVVFFMRRFTPVIEADVQSFSQQSWRSCQVRWFGAVMVPGSPYEGSVWRQAEGMALWDMAPHVFSILLPILGPVRRVSARHEGHTVCVTSHHAGGASADILLSLHAAPSEVVADFEFRGAPGNVKLAGITSTSE